MNHDYGQEGKPGAKVRLKPLGTARPGDNERNRQTMELRYEDMGKHKPQLFASKTTLGQGSAALQEHGINPNQGSGHERRPPSSSRDAACMEKANMDKGDPEYTRWLLEIKKNPPWKSKEKTPTEKVQSVTHPLGEEVGVTILQELLRNSGPAGRALGKGLGPVGIALDVLDGSEVW